MQHFEVVYAEFLSHNSVWMLKIIAIFVLKRLVLLLSEKQSLNSMAYSKYLLNAHLDAGKCEVLLWLYTQIAKFKNI